MSDADEARVSHWEPVRIAAAVDGDLKGASRRKVVGVATDTRTMEPRTLFVALEGERFDAHEFIDEALEQGARGLIVSRPPDRKVDDAWWIQVDDTEEALKTLGCAVWEEAAKAGLHTVNVTGSNGKTTTKELLRSLWSSVGDSYATPGNYNNRIGVSLTLCGLPVDTDHAIIELGANAPREIDELLRMAPGSERIITSIAPAHLEGFGGIDGVRRAKSEIGHAAGTDDALIVPVEECDNLYIDDFPGRIVTFGPEGGREADIEYDRLRAPDNPGIAQRVQLTGLGREWRAPLALPGGHNASNLAAAVATGWVRGVDFGEKAARALRHIELPSGRWRRREVDDVRFVDDAYNANPGSVEASLQAFLESEVDASAGRSILLVLGDIAEMGSDATAWHERVGVRVGRICRDANVDVDGIAVTGEHRHAVAAGFRSEVGDASDQPAIVDLDAIDDVAAWLADRRPCTVWMKASREAELERVIPLVEEALAVDEANDSPSTPE